MIILASELVSILKNLYGKCSSYSDKGIVVECDHGNKSEKVFETVFNRPGQLILKTYDSSATEEEEKAVLCISDGKATIRFPKSRKSKGWSNDSTKSTSFLFKTLAKYADQSNERLMSHESKELSPEFGLWAIGFNGISVVTYDLLFQDDIGDWINSPKPRLLSNKSIRGKDCYHLWFIEKALQLWIDKESLLISKIHFDSSSAIEDKFQRKFSNTILRVMGHHLNKYSPEFVAQLKSTSEDPSNYKTCYFSELECED